MTGTRMPTFLFASTLVALLCVVALPAPADSHARIVRLSYVAGEVQMDRGTGNGFERAILNMPVVYHSHIRTGDDGEAEIEFENGSTVRLTPGTEIDVDDLSITSSGDKITRLLLDQGLAFVQWKHSDGMQFNIQFGGHDLSLRKSSHLRIETGQDGSTVALYKGEAQVSGGAQGTVDVHTGETLTLNLSDERYFLAKSVETGPYDAWDQQRDSDRQVMVAQQNSSSYLGNSYYGADLGYYGNWFNSPYGNLWRPLGYGADWSPFSNGSWAFYPGFGWNFVSSYPWGWLPFHYGNWVFVNGVGWGWRRPHRWGGFSAFNGFNGFRHGGFAHNPALNPFSGSASPPVIASIPKPPVFSGFAGRSTLVNIGGGSAAPLIDPRGILSKRDPDLFGNGLANRVPRKGIVSGGVPAVTRPDLATANGIEHGRMQPATESNPVQNRNVPSRQVSGPATATPNMHPAPMSIARPAPVAPTSSHSPVPAMRPAPMPSASSHPSMASPRPSAPAPMHMGGSMGGGGFSHAGSMPSGAGGEHAGGARPR